MTTLAILVIFLFFKDSVDSLVFSVCLLLLLNNGHFIINLHPPQKKKKYSNNFITKYNLWKSSFDSIDQLFDFFLKINPGTVYATMYTHDYLKICYISFIFADFIIYLLCLVLLFSQLSTVIFKSLHDLGNYQSFL